MTIKQVKSTHLGDQVPENANASNRSNADYNSLFLPDELRLVWLDQSAAFQGDHDIDGNEGMLRTVAWWFLSGKNHYPAAHRKITYGLRNAFLKSDASAFIANGEQLPLLAYALWLEQTDWQTKFDLTSSRGIASFRAYWLAHGKYQLDLAGTRNDISPLTDLDDSFELDKASFFPQFSLDLPLVFLGDYLVFGQEDSETVRAQYLLSLAQSAFLLDRSRRAQAIEIVARLLAPVPSLQSPDGQYVGTVLLMIIALSRIDLQNTFDLETTAGRAELIQWWRTNGRTEHAPLIENLHRFLGQRAEINCFDFPIEFTNASLVIVQSKAGKPFPLGRFTDRQAAELAIWLIDHPDDYFDQSFLRFQPARNSEYGAQSDPMRSIALVACTDTPYFSHEFNPDFAAWWQENGQHAFSSSSSRLREYLSKLSSFSSNDNAHSFLYERRHIHASVDVPVRPTRSSAPNTVNLVGLPFEASGLGEDFRQFKTSILSAGYDVAAFADPPRYAPRSDYFLPSVPGPVTLFVQPPFLTSGFVARYGSAFFKSRVNIGFWQWELSTLSRNFESLPDVFDQLWTISDFTAKSISERFKREVLVVPSVIEIKESGNWRRADYGLSENKIIFLFVFDGNSFSARKNPMGVIEAFRRAFPPPLTDVTLLIKSYNLEDTPELVKLKEAALLDSRIVLIHEHFTREKLIGLIKCCDCFVSLHRAEGFGRLIAEAMLLGKPVIVSNYSGSRQFTNPDNAYLVDGHLVPVKQCEYLLGGSDAFEWFEPDVEQAAMHMRSIAEDPATAARKAKLGSNYIATHHNSKQLVNFLRLHLSPYFENFQR